MRIRLNEPIIKQPNGVSIISKLQENIATLKTREPMIPANVVMTTEGSFQDALTDIVAWCLGNRVAGFPLIHAFLKENKIDNFVADLREVEGMYCALQFTGGEVHIELAANENTTVNHGVANYNLAGYVKNLVKHCSKVKKDTE